MAPFDEYSSRLSEEKFRYVDLSMNNKGTNPIEDCGLIFRLYKIFKAESPHVVLTYTPKPNIYASIAAGLSGVSIIPNVSGLGAAFIRQGIVTRIVKLLYKLAMRFPAKVFFQNNDDMSLFIHLGLVKEELAERIPGSGINTVHYSSDEHQESRHGGVIFLLVARMLWDKGVGEFVDAARIVKQQFPEARFQLLGFLDVVNPQAISREQMEQWHAEGVIEYLGVSNDVKSKILAADCVVLPSYREGLPRTLIEGASLAKPLIATDVPGCRDVVDDCSTGYLCEVKNATDLADKMVMMLNLPELERVKMGERGREKVIKEFDEEIVLGKYIETIETVLDER